MRNTLYSLLLDEEVVREVDAAAHQLGTNRSQLINEILAEYVHYVTPEKRIHDVLSSIEQMMQPSREFVAFFAPHTYSMSLKSSLEVKYRPTVKYEIELYKGNSDALGELSVVYRSQSMDLVQRMTNFFLLWQSIEQCCLPEFMQKTIHYTLFPGKFERTLCFPQNTFTSDELAQSLSEYVQLFDRLLKSYLSGEFQPEDIKREYVSYLSSSHLNL